MSQFQIIHDPEAYTEPIVQAPGLTITLLDMRRDYNDVYLWYTGDDGLRRYARHAVRLGDRRPARPSQTRIPLKYLAGRPRPEATGMTHELDLDLTAAWDSGVLQLASISSALTSRLSKHGRVYGTPRAATRGDIATPAQLGQLGQTDTIAPDLVVVTVYELMVFDLEQVGMLNDDLTRRTSHLQQAQSDYELAIAHNGKAIDDAEIELFKARRNHSRMAEIIKYLPVYERKNWLILNAPQPARKKTT